MVTRKLIDALYRKYNRPPASTDELNFSLLFDYALENHGIVIDEDDLFIGSVDPSSPFAVIPLRHIHEIFEFENRIAIVLRNSIVFLSKSDSKVNVHLRMEKTSVRSRIKDSLLYRD